MKRPVFGNPLRLLPQRVSGWGFDAADDDVADLTFGMTTDDVDSPIEVHVASVFERMRAAMARAESNYSAFELLHNEYLSTQAAFYRFAVGQTHRFVRCMLVATKDSCRPDKASTAVLPTAPVAPVIPGLTDEELVRILEAVHCAGARTAAWIPVRLPGAVEFIFDEWLDRAHPGRANKIRARIRSMRGGAMNDSRFGSRMRGEGEWAKIIGDLFTITVDRLGCDREPERLSTEHFRRSQRDLFQENVRR